jgi:hypothetical protein
MVGLYLIADTVISLCSRWWRALQVLQAGSFTPTHVETGGRMSLYPEYPDEDRVVTSGNRNAA